MRVRAAIFVIFLCLDACVERMDLPVTRENPRIVVDGLISSLPGPHKVKIFKTSGIDQMSIYPRPLERAVVKIIDDLGNEETLSEEDPGVYVTSGTAIQGVIGRRYKLHFVTDDQSVYESDFQEMNPPGEVTDMRAEFVAGVINGDDPHAVHDVFRIYIDSRGVSGYANLFRWRWSATYEAITFPQYRKSFVNLLDTSYWTPTPLDCSGFEVSFDGLLVPSGICECCTCWVDEYSHQALVSKNRFFSDDEFNNVLVAEFPVDPNKFFKKYYVKLDQLSVTQDVYTFWKNLEAQQEGSQDIFQPNIIRLRGNVRCVTNPDEEVSGIFSVSGVTERELFIERADVPTVLKIDSVFDDCRKVYPGSSNVKPPFW